MIKLQKVLCFLGLLAACHPETAPAPKPPKLVTQRVAATVKREAARLIHVRTEHEVLVMTPEHPFATPLAAWVPAGRLVPGDQVVSARFGTMRVVSVQSERASQPQAVFNLTVASSHTFVVGTGQVLVHNGKCKDPAERDKEIEAVEGELEALQLRLWSSAVQDASACEARIAQLKKQIAGLKRARAAARFRRKNADGGPSAPGLEAASDPAALHRGVSGSTSRAIERIDRETRALEGTSAGSNQRLAQLRKHLTVLRSDGKRKSKLAAISVHGRLVKEAQTDHEARRTAVEAAQGELSAFLGGEPPSAAQEKSHAERRATLEKKVAALQHEQDVAREILDGERRLAELAVRSPGTDGEQLAAEQQAQRARISKLRTARRRRDFYNRKRAEPGAYEALLRQHRQWRRKGFRTAEYLADTERPRDTLELLEEELAVRRQDVGTEGLDERTEYLTKQIATLKALVEVRKARKRAGDVLRKARARRDALSHAARDTRAIDKTIARREQEWEAIRVRGVQLRLRRTLLRALDRMAQMTGPGTPDEARLRELERELEGELIEGGHLREERLLEIRQELGEVELIDAEFLESIWREAEAEERASQEREKAVQAEAADVDASLAELTQSLGEPPLLERPAAPEKDLQALQRELWQERSAVEAEDFALAEEQALLSQTLGRPGSSHHVVGGAQRLAELQQQRVQLRTDWRECVQGRLEAARQELEIRRSSQGSRDEALEVALARRIALLEHEVRNPFF